jgi:uncharacterized RDD family membrane protein YckC
MTSEKGVFFRREDYASFPLRVLVDVLDSVVFVALCAALTAPMILFLPGDRSSLNLILLTWVVVALLYFIILKRSRFRTLGYRVGRVRIVDLKGRVPGYWSLFVRLLFGTVGPMNWLLDLTWLSNDAHRQALRDKFAHTYVVRATAQIAGEGPIVFRYYTI